MSAAVEVVLMTLEQLTSSKKRNTIKAAVSRMAPFANAGGAYGNLSRNRELLNLAGYLPLRSASCPAMTGLTRTATLNAIGISTNARA